MKLKSLIEANTESIYKGDLLQVKVWSRYGIRPMNRIGYAIAKDISFKKETEKHFTFRVKGWYDAGTYWNTNKERWKGFFVNNFDSKDVIKKIKFSEIPGDLKKQVKPFIK